mgnify:CR=1 FL=1
MQISILSLLTKFQELLQKLQNAIACSARVFSLINEEEIVDVKESEETVLKKC